MSDYNQARNTSQSTSVSSHSDNNNANKSLSSSLSASSSDFTSPVRTHTVSVSAGKPPVMKYTDKQVIVRVNEARTVGSGKERTTQYKIEVSTRSGRHVEVWHRFSDFISLGDLVKVDMGKLHPQYVGGVPDTPTKRPRLLEDHFSSQFIEERTILLHLWLKRLLETPKVLTLGVVLSFLELTPYRDEVLSVAPATATISHQPRPTSPTNHSRLVESHLGDDDL